MKAPIASVRVLIALLSLTAAACSADESSGLSLNVNDHATAADVGLPAYPGATVYDDDGDGTNSANIGFSIPSFGLKVVATEMRSDDQPQRVATFYRKALAKYGDVLDCSPGSQDSRKSRHRDDAKGDLTCEGDADDDSIVYKVGTDENQRIVSVKSHGHGARFSLVHVAVRGRSN